MDVGKLDKDRKRIEAVIESRRILDVGGGGLARPDDSLLLQGRSGETSDLP